MSDEAIATKLWLVATFNIGEKQRFHAVHSMSDGEAIRLVLLIVAFLFWVFKKWR